MLASTEIHRAGAREVERLVVRKVLQGKRRWVLHIIAASLTDAPSESEPCEPSDPSQEDSYLTRVGDGSQDGSKTGDSSADVSHESEPRAAVPVSEKGGSASHGSHGSQITGDDRLSDAKDPASRSARWESDL